MPQKFQIRLCAVGILFSSLFPSMLSGAVTSDIYVAQNAVGSDSGASAENAHSQAWFNSASNWGAASGKIGPDTVVHVVGTVTNSLIFQGSGSDGHPITLLFEPGAKMSAPTWSGAWYGVSGAIQVVRQNFVVLDGGVNGLIEATASGTALQPVGSSGILLYAASHVEVKNFSINNMYVRNPSDANSGSGIGITMSGGNDNSMHDNRILHARSGISCIYPGDSSVSNIAIYNNQIANVNWGISFGDGNINALADRVDIYGNDIADTENWEDPPNSNHHDGIFPFAVHAGSKLTNLKVHDNYVHGRWGVHTTAFIYLSGRGIVSPLVYNNVLALDSASPGIPANGFICITGFAPRVFNNTIFGKGGIGVMCLTSNGGCDIQNNIIQSGTGIYLTGQAANLTDALAANPTTVDHNLYFLTVSNGIPFGYALPGGAAQGRSFLNWQAAGLDLNSHESNPLFVNSAGNDFQLTPGSLAIDAGHDLSGYFLSDKNAVGRPQGLAWDIGAYEYCASGCVSVRPTPVPSPSPQVAQAEVTRFELFKNVFNPSRGESLHISYSIPAGLNAEIKIFNLAGWEIRTLEAGTNQATWDGRTANGTLAAAGTYLLVLKCADTKLNKKVILVK